MVQVWYNRIVVAFSTATIAMEIVSCQSTSILVAKPLQPFLIQFATVDCAKPFCRLYVRLIRRRQVVRATHPRLGGHW